MMKKIVSLTKVFCKEYFSNLPIYKKNKKNILFSLVIILNIALGYLSHTAINFLQRGGQEKIFLDILFLIINIITMYQTALACANIFYFSKDIEYILPYPIKPIELLISKFNTLLSLSYVTELLFCSVPLIIYGLMTGNNIFYYYWLIIILIIFPIFMALIITIIMLIIINLLKFIKNKDTFQIIVTIILVLIFSAFQMFAIDNINIENNIEQPTENIEENNQEIKINNKIEEINKYFLIINPTTEILNENNNLNCLINFIKIILIEIIFFIIFILIGKKIYLNNLIKNISKINTKKIIKNNKKIKYKKINKNKKYIIQEFKNLIKNPTFLIQCIFPTIIAGILIATLVIIFYPVVIETIQLEMEIEEVKIEFNMQTLIIILSIIQIIFIFSNISLTAITRKGKNAVFIKYIPIDLYKQFLFMNIPQILFNNISIIIILKIIKYLIPEINLFNILIIFILGNLLNIINSLLMLIVDLKRPNLNWDNETAAIKENGNKLFQYALTIIIILFLIYLNELFKNINFNLSIILINIILILIIFLINIFVKKNIKKLYKKIY